MDQSARASPRLLAFALLALALGTGLRLAGSTGDLWFDELWSVQKARHIERALDVLLQPELQHDNNHWLNTLWLHRVGASATPFVQRAPAWLASLLTLLVMGWIGGRRGALTGVLALLLASSSFLLVQYGTEARGYAGAVLFSLLCFALLARGDGRASWRVPAFWGATLLGVGSHVTFLYSYFALLVWHPLRLWRSGARRSLGPRLALFHGLPLGVIAILYITTIRHMVIGGGPRHPTARIVLDTLGLVFGLPTDSAWAYLAGVFLAAVVVAEVFLRYRERDDTALFFPWVLVVAPALFLAVREPEVLYVRYFLVCVPFGLLLLASLLARAFQGGPALRIGSALVLLGMLAGNAFPLADFVRIGRGQYAAAVRFLAEESPAGPIEIGAGGEHNLWLLRHQTALVAPQREFVFLSPEVPAPRPPRWILIDSLDPHFAPEPELTGAFARHYVLAREFRYAGLSGQCWFLYRRSKGARAEEAVPGR